MYRFRMSIQPRKLITDKRAKIIKSQKRILLNQTTRNAGIFPGFQTTGISRRLEGHGRAGSRCREGNAFVTRCAPVAFQRHPAGPLSTATHGDSSPPAVVRKRQNAPGANS
jgi:hypothetical protein